MLRIGTGSARTLLVAVLVTTVGGGLLHAYAYYMPFEPNKYLIRDAVLIRLAGLILLGFWYCSVTRSRSIPFRPPWSRYWFLTLIAITMSAESYVGVGFSHADIAFFFLGVLGVYCIGPLLLLNYGWVALCRRLGDGVPQALLPASLKRADTPLDPGQLRSLQLGTTMILAAIGALVLLVCLSFFLSPPGGATRGAQPVAGPAIVITSLAAVAAVLQIVGKLMLLRVGNALERGALLIAISIESFGVCLRLAAAMIFGSDPQTAAMLSVCALLCHGNELFLAYFFWSLAGRIGTTTSLNLARALFACTAAIVVAVLIAILEPRSLDALEFAIGTVVICGILGFVLLLALLNSLRLLATSKIALDQR